MNRALVLAFVVLTAVGCSKYVTKGEVALDAAKGLEVVVKTLDEPADCGFWACWVRVGESWKGDDETLRVVLDSKGDWVAYAKNEHFNAKNEDTPCPEQTEEGNKAWEEAQEAEKESEDKDAEAKADAEGEEEGEEAKDESWKDEPELSWEERHKKGAKEALGAFCIEKASGTLQASGEDRTLTIAAELLPEGEFYVYSNGYFGAQIDGMPIGSPTKTGGFLVKR